MMKALAFAALPGLVSVASASDPVFLNGKSYRNPQVETVEKGLAYLSSMDGKFVVPIASLPPSLKSKALVLAQKKLAAEHAAAMRSPKEHRESPDGEIQGVVRVDHVIPEGILGDLANGQKVLLKNHPDAGKVANGEELSFRGSPAGAFKYKSAPGTETTARIYKVVSRD